MLADKFVWDLTYACPLRCVHCYSESGRRPARTLPPEDLLRIADMMIPLKPKWVALSGGEPLLVRGWSEVARRLRDAGVYVMLYTSGWTLDEALAEEIFRSVSDVCVSIDGATEATHDRLRQRAGSYRKARAALELLARFKLERKARGETGPTLGTDFTVVRSNIAEAEQFVTDVTASYPGLDYMRLGMAVPEGPAADEDFAEQELLTTEDALALAEAGGRLKALARNGVRVSVTDMRYYIPYSPYGGAGATIAHIEPDGELRAFGVYEAKVGNVLREPFEVLWSRALAWRNEPFVAEQIKSIQTNHDWARVARVLDRRYGSEDDKARIARRIAGRGRPI
jgi:MoaA/NifB/PqqE/SkfB family radical SAM enzyme